MYNSNNFGPVKQAILECLADHEIHDSANINSYIKSALPERNISKSLLFTSISQLTTHGIPIHKLGDGRYQLAQAEPILVKSAQIYVQKSLLECKKHLTQQLSFDLSNEEYCALKKLYIQIENFYKEIKDDTYIPNNN